MEGKNILQVVKLIKEDKAYKVEAQRAKENQKLKDRAAFYKCKKTCTCHKSKCDASGLKECSSCHNILQSICGKAACQKNRKRPIMIYPSAVGSSNACGRVNQENDTDSESGNDYSEDEFESESESMQEQDSERCDTLEQAVQSMKETWRFLSPPNAESTIIKKWYAVCYQGKRSETLFVAKASRRFLKDKDGPVDSILMKCLKPKIGSGNILEDTPKHLPADEATFSISDVIAGPLEVIPKGATQFIVLCYENVKSKFELVKKIDRTCLVAQI
jgi:hypothetical protein